MLPLPKDASTCLSTGVQVHTCPCTLAQRQVCSCLDLYLVYLSLSTMCAASCQLHSAHTVIILHLQAYFLWHHSKDCIQVQHNFTR